MGTYTGLILVTGESKPGVEETFRETLAPFTIEILDLQSMDIRGRYFLTIHFSLDKAHTKAIENDLQDTANRLQLDLAIDYRSEI
jgi:predicted amino acid-binding ACT domain protein